MKQNLSIIEALIFSSDIPLSEEKIIEMVYPDNSAIDMKQLIEEINKQYKETNRPFRIEKISGGYVFVTVKEFSPYIKRLFHDRLKKKISRSALECLSIVAVKQPITRVEVDQIRGVNSSGAMNTLLEKNLITIKGKKKVAGNPLLYGTTDFFLMSLGINSLDDLPNYEKIKEIIKEEEETQTMKAEQNEIQNQ